MTYDPNTIAALRGFWSSGAYRPRLRSELPPITASIVYDLRTYGLVKIEGRTGDARDAVFSITELGKQVFEAAKHTLQPHPKRFKLAQVAPVGYPDSQKQEKATVAPKNTGLRSEVEIARAWKEMARKEGQFGRLPDHNQDAPDGLSPLALRVVEAMGDTKASISEVARRVSASRNRTRYALESLRRRGMVDCDGKGWVRCNGGANANIC